jgi:hypothetical protein
LNASGVPNEAFALRKPALRPSPVRKRVPRDDQRLRLKSMLYAIDLEQNKTITPHVIISFLQGKSEVSACG